MKAVLFHAGAQRDADLEAIYTELSTTLQAQGWSVETKRLETMSIRPCTGCFTCWLKTPGVCVQADDGREVARAYAQSDAILCLTPISFGGYSGLLKTALDRILPYASPLFRVSGGEIHHMRRYPREPRFLVVGWQRQPDAEAAAVFTQLVERNVANMQPPAYACLVLNPKHTPDERHAQITAAVRQIGVAQ